MIVPVESDMREKEAGSSWYSGVDLEWRPSPPIPPRPPPPPPPPPPPHANGHGHGHGHHASNGSKSSHGVNGSRKRSWEDATTPGRDAMPPATWNTDWELRPDSHISPPFSVSTVHSGNTGMTWDSSEDGVEEIRRTKMQTGCIPCL
jgi:hypothetical protein